MGPRFELRALAAATLAIAILWGGRARSEDATAASKDGRVALGRQIFFDRALSEPRGTSCASCHEPARAYAGDHGSGKGVARGSRPGVYARRTTPSLFYLKYVPKFRFYSDEDDNHALDAEPYGGFFWDGRADSIADLASLPLLNPREMNNRDPAQIADKLRRAPYAAAFRIQFPGALDEPANAVAALGAAIEEFLTSPAMSPFSSKFDDYVRGLVKLRPDEARGLALFKDPHRGGCTKCHKLDDASPDPARSLFTDYGYEAVGAPRNPSVSAEDDRGLCERTAALNPSDGAQYCVSFRTPSLRNVALRNGFMHNGAFTRLRDVVRFYATRAAHPERYYAGGVRFDDTPAAYRGLVDVTSVPYNRRPGDPPAFDDAEIDAIVAFLGTLTDRATNLGKKSASPIQDRAR